jgi:hypothetical protein
MSLPSFRWGAAAVAVAIVVSACGSSSSSSTNGIASKSANEIVSSTNQAIKTAKSVHVSGSLVSSGEPITLDLNIVSGKGGSGQMSENGLTFQLVNLNKTVYVKGTPAFWRHFGGSAAAQLFQGKWLKAPATGNFASFAQLTNLPTLFSRILSSHGTLAKGSPTTVNGQKVIAVKDTTEGGTLYVSTTGQPYPVQISKTGSDGGRLVFDHYNRPVTLTAPSNAIDITQFQK